MFPENSERLLSSECAKKPKLRTFVLFKDFDTEACYITKPISFFQRRMLAKTRLGCLPIRLETGRYSIPRLTESERICLVCRSSQNSSTDPVESEIHYLFDCNAYNTERDTWYSKMTLPENFQLLGAENKLKIVLNEHCNVKHTAQFILDAYNIRSKVLK